MPFEKGKSGNPSGRPKENTEIKELCKTYCKEVIEKLIAIVRNSEESREVIAAGREILDRGLGKPIQGVELEGDLQIFVEIGKKSATDQTKP